MFENNIQNKAKELFLNKNISIEYVLSLTGLKKVQVPPVTDMSVSYWCSSENCDFLSKIFKKCNYMLFKMLLCNYIF